MNFLKNLPYFLVLLFALQRFTSADWDLIPGFVYETAIVGWNTLGNTILEDKTLVRNKDQWSRNLYSVSGRCSKVVTGTMDVTQSLMVLEPSFAEASRPNEADVIKKGLDILKGYPPEIQYLPEIVASYQYPDSSSDRIRDDLGITREAR